LTSLIEKKAVASLSVVVAVGKKERTILSVYPQLKQDQCLQVKEQQQYQEKRKLKEKLEKIKDLTTQELN
jgi:hypothetical protein